MRHGKLGKVIFIINIIGLIMCVSALYLDSSWFEGYIYLTLFLFYLINLLYED